VYDWSAKNVLELGAGIGLNSLTAQALGARTVTVTDGDAQVLALAAQNFNLNFPEATVTTTTSATPSSSSSRSSLFQKSGQNEEEGEHTLRRQGNVRFQTLRFGDVEAMAELKQWPSVSGGGGGGGDGAEERDPKEARKGPGSDDESSDAVVVEEVTTTTTTTAMQAKESMTTTTSEEQAFAFDLILGSDLTYSKASWPSFVSTIKALSSPAPGRTEVLYATSPRLQGEWEALQRMFEDGGFQVTDVALLPAHSSRSSSSSSSSSSGSGGGHGHGGGTLTDDIRIMRLTKL
jgi:hypothetical protein